MSEPEDNSRGHDAAQEDDELRPLPGPAKKRKGSKGDAPSKPPADEGATPIVWAEPKAPPEKTPPDKPNVPPGPAWPQSPPEEPAEAPASGKQLGHAPPAQSPDRAATQPTQTPEREEADKPQEAKPHDAEFYGFELPSVDYRFKIAEDTPEDTAQIVLTRFQRLSLIVLVLGLAVWVWSDYVFCLTVVNGIFTTFYLVVCVYKFQLIHLSLGAQKEMRFTEEQIAGLRDDELPMYTIQVPLYKEPESLPRLVEGLKQLDYPKDKLDVQLLMEEDDPITVQTARAMDLPPFIRCIVTPDAQPKTKPKACNLGLSLAKGKYLVIYDAEDRPEKDQLKKAILAFREAPDKIICLQAKLNFYNRHQNLLTRWFTTEYSMWFDLFLPGLDHMDAPIPLGGTSNHFRVDKLKELRGWDPYNVTEDADLGIRIVKRGWGTKIIDSTTWEEACSVPGYWVRQRSRWVKGYLQTWLVHMRRPLSLIRELGFGRWLSFQLMVGGTPLSLLINPVYWLLTVIWFAFRFEPVSELFPFPIILGALVCLFVGNFVFIFACMLAAYRRGYYDLVKFALIVPLYWFVMSIGAWKGFLQLIYNPSYWEKTKHGFDLAEQAAAGE